MFDSCVCLGVIIFTDIALHVPTPIKQAVTQHPVALATMNVEYELLRGFVLRPFPVPDAPSHEPPLLDTITRSLFFTQAYKYIPYGEVGETIPYLLRRAQENSDMLGGAKHERGLLLKEIRRRLTGRHH